MIVWLQGSTNPGNKGDLGTVDFTLVLLLGVF